MGIRTCRWSVCSLSVSHGQAEGHVTQARRRRGRFPALAFDSTQQSGSTALSSSFSAASRKRQKGKKRSETLFFFFFFPFLFFFPFTRVRRAENLLITHSDRIVAFVRFIYMYRGRARARFFSLDIEK